MKNLIAAVSFTLLLFSQCAEEEVQKTCSTVATVKDLTGLDGCGYVFELEDGTRIEPVRTYMLMCGTPPFPKEVTEDPLFNFNFQEGKRVLISYALTDAASICMAGLPAKITCLTEISGDEMPDPSPAE